MATAGLSAPQIALPIRHILRKQRSVRVLLGEAIGFDLPGRRVQLADGAYMSAWLFVDVFFLIGFRNRAATLAGWAWSYMTNQRRAALILMNGSRSECASSSSEFTCSPVAISFFSLANSHSRIACKKRG